jgi:hypothetical protein
MFRITQVMAVVAALAVMPAVTSAQGSGQRGRTYQEHDASTRTTFTAAGDANGNAVLTLKGGDFVLEKVVAPTGEATLRLSQGKDVVSIALSQSGFQIARGQKTVRVDPRSDKEDKADAVRSVLLGSQAVRSFKRLVAAIEERTESEEDGLLALSTLVDGAIVLLLDGDPDATRRIAKRITRKQRAGLRAINAKRAPGVYYDCVGGYQIALLDAWGQMEECYIESTEYSWWSRSLVFMLCRWEWAFRSQQYLWQFVSCFTFPW